MSKNPFIKALTALAFVILVVMAYIRFFSPQTIHPDINNETITPIPTVMISPSEDEKSISEVKGQVEGKICFPSSFVPEGYILAKNIETNMIEKTYFEGVPPNNQDYLLFLDEGKYVFAYAKMDGIAMGFYTPCAPTASINDCSSPQSHELIEVEVEAGDTVNSIDLCDYYYQEDQRPNF